MESSLCEYSNLVNVVNGDVKRLRKISEDVCFSWCVPRSTAW